MVISLYMDRKEAIALLKKYVRSKSLLKHCLSTAAVMKMTGEYLNEDSERWEITGILHDIDFEAVGEDMQRHGVLGEKILLENGVDEDIASVIRRHNHMLFSGEYEMPVEIVLQAADSVSGLVTACALVKGGKLSAVTSKTVKKKFKDKGFAAGCERGRIKLIEPLVPLPVFYQLAIDGMMEIKDDLDLE